MTDVPTVPLGGTDLMISRIGFGAWAIGGAGWRYSWGAQDDRDSIAAVHRAVELGVNWIDTAAVYGLGHSEEVVGQALAGLPASRRPYVFTKCGLVWDDRDPLGAPRKVMEPAGVRRELEASLRRLGVEQIDLYQVHWPGDGRPLEWGAEAPAEAQGTPLEEYWQLMADLRTEGKVRAIGLSNHGPEQLAAAAKVARVDAIQPQFSLLSRSAAADLAWAAANDAAAVVYQPLASGLLTGAFTAERVAGLDPEDWRRGFPDFTTELPRNLALVDALRPVAERHGSTVSAVAVAWTLAWPGVSGAIVGARRPGQIDDWAGAVRLKLDAADLDAITAALARTGAGSGPLRP
ncbi:aldo/keto reductase [Kitasatospora herbaricolor]|uniref:aldo/keto reductase n=1 Tax=Kitasatospora herbaricolor TaxID=68217 RepID=UPI00174B215F|nr:aldo/keto reductase [Kitasatospora herbaricolor]MDQ0312514.1 aryl-alcohol dehydrogenase-like predicted oxidoreductase [Kitasatospora herbaricolor]GGV30185.1 aldo/keto reductase [Kitasatospora herbaricolor]